MTIRLSVGYSALLHMLLFSALFLTPWLRPPPDVIWLDSFEYLGGGGGGGGPGGGGAPGVPQEKMGQVVPEPVQAPVPERAQPIQRATVGDEVWKVKDEKSAKPEPVRPAPRPAPETADVGARTQDARSNVVRVGVPQGATAGAGGFDFGDGTGSGGGTGGGTGTGVGIGFGPGEGAGGFGFGSYLRIVRQRIWAEWGQSPIYGDQLVCIVGLTVGMNGSVSNIQIEQSSGNSFYDTVALRAVRNASPLPPLPPNFPRSSQRFRIQFRLLD